MNVLTASPALLVACMHQQSRVLLILVTQVGPESSAAPPAFTTPFRAEPTPAPFPAETVEALSHRSPFPGNATPLPRPEQEWMEVGVWECHR